MTTTADQDMAEFNRLMADAYWAASNGNLDRSRKLNDQANKLWFSAQEKRTVE